MLLLGHLGLLLGLLLGLPGLPLSTSVKTWITTVALGRKNLPQRTNLLTAQVFRVC